MLFDRLNLLHGKRKYLIGLTLFFLFVAVICVAFCKEGRSDFDQARTEILLRRLGHELLLQAGDSTSRILPVEKVGEREYRIRFEQRLAFQPESLLNTTRVLLAKQPLVHDYVVNVLNCGTSDVVYGFAIAGDKRNDIVPCLGREQPKGCYTINIKFKPTRQSESKGVYIFGGLSALVFVAFLFFKPIGLRRGLDDDQATEIFTFGAVQFDPEQKQLKINNEITDLTRTEARLFHIFAGSPNQILPRERLQKEIWEDEGVIVGRSLDMFISKLRKKLEPDPHVNIVVVRSKGYRLEAMM